MIASADQPGIVEAMHRGEQVAEGVQLQVECQRCMNECLSPTIDDMLLYAVVILCYIDCLSSAEMLLGQLHGYGSCALSTECK